MIELKRWLAVAAMLLAVTGCKKADETPTGTVQGKVMLGSAPLTSGQVEFFSSAAGIGASAPVKDDGSYQIPTPLPIGEYSISVSGVLPEPGLPEPPPTKVPKKYWSAKTSGISQIVSEGPNTLDFKLNEK